MTLQMILAEIEQANLDKERVRDLFHLLNLPLTIARFPVALQTLRHILSTIDRTWPLEIRKLNLLWMPPLIEELNSLFPESKSSRSVAATVEQIKKRNPLYSALIEPCQITDEQLRTKFDLLFAHVLLAHLKVMQKTNRGRFEAYTGDDLWGEIKFSPYYACLTIRDFAKQKPQGDDLLKAFPVLLRPARFARTARLSEVPDVDLSRTLRVVDWIRYIASFLKGAYDLRDRCDVGERSRSRAELGDPDDPNANAGNAKVYEQSPGDFEGKKLRQGGLGDQDKEHRRKQALEADNCPEEDEEEDEQILAASFEPGRAQQSGSHFDRTPESYRGMVRAMRNQVIRDNKNFAFGYERLMPFELAKIEVKCRRDLVPLLQRKSLSQRQQQDAENLALLLATLWLGKGRAPYLTIVDAVSDRPEVDYALVLPQGQAPSMFRMRVEFPTYKWLQQDEVGDRKRNGYVLLPDYFDLGNVLIRIHEMQPQRENEEKGRVFPDQREQYPRLSGLLHDLDPTGRMTLSKVAAAWSGYVTSLTGNDVVAAKIITGFDSRVSRVAMFYACRSQQNINQVFHHCATSLLREIWNDRGVKKEAPSEYSDPDWKEIYIGVRLCPAKDAVRKGVDRILGRMKKPGITLGEYHNLLVLYTTLFVGYATLIRGIRDPLILPRDISPLTSMALVRDKTSDSGDKAKYVYIPRSLKDHLDFFASHLQRPDLIKDPSRTFYFYTEDGGIEDVSPTTVAARLREFLPFPAAVHRRFSFNELLEAGCPPEVVRVCMGHSTIGDEPWSSFSTFSFSKYRKTLDGYIEPLLESLGFEAPGKKSGQGD